jgi:hypothetical protein
MKIITAVVAVFIVIPLNAEARPYRSHTVSAGSLNSGCNVAFPCEVATTTTAMVRSGRRMRVTSGVEADAGQVIGGRPAGCPRAYCGCGASIHLFGRIIPRLNLATNWLSFPRANPAPKMVAVRRGHVFVLERQVEGNIWLVHNSNAGRGATRVHQASIAGYAIVNPFAGATM